MSSSDWMKFVDQLHLAQKIIFTLIAVFIALGNTLVLVTTWKERSLHEPNKYFIAWLAVADLFVGIFLAPLFVYQLNLDIESLRAMSIHLCRFIIWIDTFALTASIYSLAFISFDRYLKISKPLQYRSRMTTSKSLKIIFIIWLISTVFATYATNPRSGSWGILLTSSLSYSCPFDSNNSKGFYTFVAVSLFFLPTVVILVMYGLIFVVAHKRQKRLRNGELGETCNSRNQRNVFVQDLKVIRMLLAVVGVFIFCWGPYFIYILLWYHHPNFDIWHRGSFSYRRRIAITELLIFTLPYLNSLCNPIIYACLDQRYREGLKNLIQRVMCQTNSRHRRPSDATELSTRSPTEN